MQGTGACAAQETKELLRENDHAEKLSTGRPNGYAMEWDTNAGTCAAVHERVERASLARKRKHQ